MPIRPDLKPLYPKNWSEIRAKILERANHRCERCKVANYRVGFWIDGQWNDNTLYDEQGNYPKTYAEAAKQREMGNRLSEYQHPNRKLVVVVLTIAHIHDPNPANCADENLEALCQACHNRLDASMRAKNASATRVGKRVRAGQATLIEAGGAA
jgi:5-methylcytosine-specific restriction endonuclease McrA